MANRKQKVIGVLGGCGPYAGLQLVKNIFDQTIAGTDQEHLPVYLSSVPGDIADRTAYLLNPATENPAFSIAGLLSKLEEAGAEVAGIACNTSHAPAIYEVICGELQRTGSRIKLLHIVDETIRFLRETSPHITKVGILCSDGTYRTKLYENRLLCAGYDVIRPSEAFQHMYIHQCIYDEQFGIKAHSSPVTNWAKECIAKAAAYFEEMGAEALILGCTEFSLAIGSQTVKGMQVVDSVKVLARALIRDTAPAKLRPLPGTGKLQQSSIEQVYSEIVIN
jgi:aspartate racemase